HFVLLLFILYTRHYVRQSCSFFFFFFSSRRRHTRFSRDWSSDVCSSDLVLSADERWRLRGRCDECCLSQYAESGNFGAFHHEPRSEERRVGKECRTRWSP